MTRRLHLRYLLSVILLSALLSPTAALAGNGKKHFQRGMKHESAEEWDKAAEAFALAVAENPKNPEYQLHFKRALFMASQMYIKIGAMLAKEKDYVGAYNAYRKAYAFDPVNELAKNEMDRMVRLEEEAQKPAKQNDGRTPVKGAAEPQVPQFETINVGPYPSGIEVQTLIKDLAKSLDLNVIFDSESFRPGQRNPINIELSNVTAARALDYIFLQQNLFFQKVGPRTIVVANGNQRQKFQQLVLKTFYLANANPKDVQKVVQTAIPAQPGRSPTITLIDEPTNSITIRDTEENIRLIGSLIKSLDKDRAEVVMDVAIYEVSKADLLKLGNQIGNDTQLTTLGGTTRGIIGANSGGKQIFGNLINPSSPIPTAFGVGWAVPAANLQAFQSKGNTKLLASTQIHAFNNQDSTARIGQRVPVRSASFAPVLNPGANNNTNNFVGDVIQYEQVGLTLKFKPLVFPNQDVQVDMKIESKDVVAGGSSQNPTFSERTIEGTARVQNNKTLLLASVAQDVQSDTRSGIPLLGLIPILGRLFTAPTNENRQVDIVIAITPRVIRVPSITPEDEVERPTGSIAVPTSGSLESLVAQEEMDERLASARRLGDNTQIQLPDQPVSAPEYVRADPNPVGLPPASTDAVALKTVSGGGTEKVAVKPIESGGVRSLQVTPAEPKPETNSETAPPVRTEAASDAGGRLSARVEFVPALPFMNKGERAKIAVRVDSASDFRSAVLGLRYNPFNLAVMSVSFGDVFGAAVRGKEMAPFINQDGKTYVALSTAKDVPEANTGILAYIEVEALGDGQFVLGFDRDVTTFLTSEGRSFAVKF